MTEFWALVIVDGLLIFVILLMLAIDTWRNHKK